MTKGVIDCINIETESNGAGLMAKEFHKDEFDDTTQLKLAIFRKYTREWLPTFLTEPAHGRGPNFNPVNIYDFFAGPGRDIKGNKGSPLIIQDELKAFCESRGNLKSDAVAVRLYFNDDKKGKVEQLRRNLEGNACPKSCCETLVTAKPFSEALDDYLPKIQNRRSANLVIMDQCGIKEVTPEVVNTLANCTATDILFFVSSGFIRRFSGEPSFKSHIRVSSEKLATSPHRLIHRQICDHFRSEIGPGTTYHLAPFSLKKPGGNIYGVIFGSGKLIGLDKFLKVCWNLDSTTGEANYDIDDDRIDRQQKSLFAEMDVPTKLDRFNQDLEENLIIGALTDNRDVYRFTLQQGCLPNTHAKEHLRKLQDSGRLTVIDRKTNAPAKRKGVFYVTWDNYEAAEGPRVRFTLKKE